MVIKEQDVLGPYLRPDMGVDTKEGNKNDKRTPQTCI